MKLKRSQIIALIIVIIATSLIFLKLRSNKNGFKEDIAFAQRKIDKVPVTVEKITKGILSENITATSVLEASEVLNLVSETQGKIIKIHKKKGDKVSCGDIIVKVDDEVIAANVLTAEANYAQYQKDVERYTRLSEENAITKRDLEQATIGLKKAKADLINANKTLYNTSIKAPISGYINSENLTEGQLLGGGSPVCEIVNNSKLKLNIKVSEHEVYRVKNGQSVVIRLSVFPDKTFTGHITSIAEKADGAMKFNVEITLVNDANAHLKSGLYAEVELPVKNEEKLIVNKNSIVGSMEHPIVYVASNGKAIRRELVVGQSNNSQIEVLSGLLEGEEIIVSGQLNLKNGDDINIIK
jgi:membrane fusion protein, multidrug efflux system